MQLYTDVDRQFEDFIFHEKNVKRDDIQMFLSGRGLTQIYEFLAKKYPKKSKLLDDKVGNFEHIKPEDITIYAEKENDELCLDTVNYFIDYLAKYLTDVAFTFLPFGGLYLTASVIIAMEFMFERPEVRERFLNLFQNRGGLTGMLKQFPLIIVKQ